MSRQVKFYSVSADRINDMMERNPEKVEVFVDDDGAIYFVSKGDLEAYELKHYGVKKETQEKIIPNMFLEENEFELF